MLVRFDVAAALLRFDDKTAFAFGDRRDLLRGSRRRIGLEANISVSNYFSVEVDRCGLGICCLVKGYLLRGELGLDVLDCATTSLFCRRIAWRFGHRL